MRALFRSLTLGLSLLVASAACAAGLDDAKVAASGRATDEIMRRFQLGPVDGALPRRSDPAVAGLLDAAFDTTMLGQGPLPLSTVEKLEQIYRRVVPIGSAYLLDGTGLSEFDATHPKVLERFEHNVLTYGSELGQWIEFGIAVQHAVAAGMQDVLSRMSPAGLEKLDVKRVTAGARAIA